MRRLTRSPCTNSAPRTRSYGAVEGTSGSATPPASTGAITTPRILPSAPSISPIRRAAPSTFPMSRRSAISRGRIFTVSTAQRDLAWQDLYRKYRGQIDEQFAYLAFRTAPLVSASTMDAKVITAEMANNMMVWGAIGKPNQREWVAGGRSTYEKNDGLFPSGYSLFTTAPPNQLAEIEQARLNPKPPESGQAAAAPRPGRPAANNFRDRLWKGWIVPAADSDTWFAAGCTAYHTLLAADDLEKALEIVGREQ